MTSLCLSWELGVSLIFYYKWYSRTNSNFKIKEKPRIAYTFDTSLIVEVIFFHSSNMFLRTEGVCSLQIKQLINWTLKITKAKNQFYVLKVFVEHVCSKKIVTCWNYSRQKYMMLSIYIKLKKIKSLVLIFKKSILP